jgi:hypothetical protein
MKSQHYKFVHICLILVWSADTEARDAIIAAAAADADRMRSAVEADLSEQRLRLRARLLKQQERSKAREQEQREAAMQKELEVAAQQQRIDRERVERDRTLKYVFVDSVSDIFH